jgi:Clostripain family
MASQHYCVAATNAVTVIIEFFGHDNDLRDELPVHLNAIQAHAGAGVAVLALADEPGGARILEIQGGQDPLVLKRLGPVDMSDKALLGEFLRKALASYPQAQRIAIGFSGHGTGIFEQPGTGLLNQTLHWLRSGVTRIATHFTGPQSMLVPLSLIIDQSGHWLSNPDASAMMRDAFASLPRARVDLLFFASCISGMVEVATEFAIFADCLVASETNIPDSGWDHGAWLSKMGNSPPADGESWGVLAADALEAAYRALPDERPVSLTVLRTDDDLSQVLDRFREFVVEADSLGFGGFSMLNRVRSRSAKMNEHVDSVDLLDFAGKVELAAGATPLGVAARRLSGAVKAAIVKTIPLSPRNANGLGFWFPRSPESMDQDIASYRKLRFDSKTHWSDYLETNWGRRR